MRTIHALALSALVVATPASPRKASPRGFANAPAATEPLTISIAVGGKTYEVSGKGECKHTALASYRDMRAAMWQVEYNTEGKTGLTNLVLTAWRPLAGGADQMSLYVGIGSGKHRIDTVKGSQNVGSGTLSVKPTGTGGIFEIEGKDEKGTSIKGTVECGSFSAPEAVAG